MKDEPNRVGTNLLTAEEAGQMLRHVVGHVLDDLSRMTEERDQLRRERDEARGQVLEYDRLWQQGTHPDLDSLRSKLAGAEKALEWYADRSLYDERRSHPENATTDLKWDIGSCAREALASLRAGEGET